MEGCCRHCWEFCPNRLHSSSLPARVPGPDEIFPYSHSSLKNQVYSRSTGLAGEDHVFLSLPQLFSAPPHIRTTYILEMLYSRNTEALASSSGMLIWLVRSGARAWYF